MRDLLSFLVGAMVLVVLALMAIPIFGFLLGLFSVSLMIWGWRLSKATGRNRFYQEGMVIESLGRGERFPYEGLLLILAGAALFVAIRPFSIAALIFIGAFYLLSRGSLESKFTSSFFDVDRSEYRARRLRTPLTTDTRRQW